MARKRSWKWSAIGLKWPEIVMKWPEMVNKRSQMARKRSETGRLNGQELVEKWHGQRWPGNGHGNGRQLV